ncbi:MAG: hypothetical protein RSA75_09685 [Bacteroidales bacterium]
MYKQLKIILILFSVTFVSCTKFVWEDRSECPCILTLDLSNVDKNVSELHLWIFGEDNSILSRDTIAPDRFGGTYDVLIKREMVKYYVWGNIKGATKLQDNLTLNSTLTKVENSSADSLYHYSKQLNTNFESQTDTVLLNKEFISVNVTLKSTVSKFDKISLEMYGNSAGFYIDKRFIGGIGKITCVPDGNNKENNTVFKYRLTRQEYLQDISIVIIVTTRQGIPIVLTDFPLGNYLQENGYNMQAKNLSDIKIDMDLSANIITIKVDNWQVTVPGNIEI